MVLDFKSKGQVDKTRSPSSLIGWLIASGPLLVLLLTSNSVLRVDGKKDRNQPHRHQGMLPAYEPDSFDRVTISKKEEEILAQGKPIMKQSMPPTKGPQDKDEEQSGGALCIQDVDAPVEAVWYQILDFNNYKAKVPNIKICQNYAVTESKPKKGPKSVNIKTRMVLSAMPGFAFESFYDHTYFPEKSSLTWKLDYSKTSDFDDVSGHWHVESVGGGDKPKSRVFYACDIQMSGPVPTPLLNYIGKAALKKATAWVKRESEAHPELKSKYTPQTTPVTKSESLTGAGATNSRGGGSGYSLSDGGDKDDGDDLNSNPTNGAFQIKSRLASFFQQPKFAFLHSKTARG